MGLGKTIQVIALISYVRSLELLKQKPILIVAPLGLINTSWIKDGFEAFLNEEVFGGFDGEGSFKDIVNFADCPFKPDLLISVEDAETVNNKLSDGVPLSQCELNEQVLEEMENVKKWVSGKLIITSYETARNRGIALAGVNFSLVILDEAQKIKNQSCFTGRRSP